MYFVRFIAVEKHNGVGPGQVAASVDLKRSFPFADENHFAGEMAVAMGRPVIVAVAQVEQ